MSALVSITDQPLGHIIIGWSIMERHNECKRGDEWTGSASALASAPALWGLTKVRDPLGHYTPIFCSRREEHACCFADRK